MALDTGPAELRDLDLRELPDEEVRHERNALAAVISQGPPDPTDELDRLRERWAPIEHALTSARRELDDTRARLDAGGLRRVERGRLEHAVLEVESRIGGLEERLAELVPRVREVGEQHRVWREWAAKAEPQLRRYLVVEEELADRGREVARWAQRVPGGEIVDLAGRRPDGYVARSRWRLAVDAISRHAVRWGAATPDRGAHVRVRELEVARQRQARQLERALAELAQRRELGRSVERDVGPSL